MIDFVEFLDNTTKDCISEYISNLNELDISVRDMSNYNKYVIESIPSTFKRTIASDIHKIENKIEVYKKLYNIPWKIAILQVNVENNLPHTHNDVIFLPNTFLELNDNSRWDILLHEKLHVFQRKYPIETQYLYTKVWSIIPYALRTYQTPFRSNPDINHIIYSYFSSSEKVYIYDIATYNTNARRITDSFIKKEVAQVTRRNNTPNNIYEMLLHKYNIKQTEHPNEVMACLLTDICLNNVHHDVTIQWMKKYM